MKNGDLTLLNRLFSDDFTVGLAEIATHPAVILLIAVLIELFLPIPDKWRLKNLTFFFSKLGRRVNKPNRSVKQIEFAGTVLPLLIIAIFMALLLLLKLLVELDLIIDLLLLPLLLYGHKRMFWASLIEEHVKREEKDEAKRLLEKQLKRDCRSLSLLGISKAAFEHCLMYLFVNWWSVMIWYLTAGLQGALLISLVSLLSRVYSIKVKSTRVFGASCYKLLQFLLILPAIPFVLIMSAHRHGWDGLRRALGTAQTWPGFIPGLITAVTGARLNIALGGPRIYDGVLTRLPACGGSDPPAADSAFLLCRLIRIQGLLFLIFWIGCEFML